MAELCEAILGHLARYDETGAVLNTVDMAVSLGEDHQRVIGAVKSLQSLGDVIRSEQVSSKQWELTDEGDDVADKGSHEALVFYAVPSQGISQAELMKLLPNAKIGFSKAMSSGWITIDKMAAGGPNVLRKVESIEDTVQRNLLRLRTSEAIDIPDNVKLDYKKRKLLQEVIIKSMNVSKGSEFSTSVSKQETDLTPEMIASGSWKEKKFKPYNFNAMGVSPIRGHLHPLMRMRTQFRQIFLEMGFTEMPTNNFIESSFWNFDALFVPQKHPARDMQDTFFVSEPKYAQTFPMEYLNRVHRVHEDGDYGSMGYKYKWKMDEAKKNVLRTHTTASSARMLHELAQQKTFTPVKYFSIDRVFRNETLDATHLAEFFQIEGVIADYDLSLGDLIGVINEFFKKLGITKLRFKPAYNPYTEPSMEMFSFHDGFKKWVELGNSGIFRPEMLRPMGFPNGVTVIAWGLSLERPTMIKFGIDNIRDLEGHKVNLQMVYEAPICRLDKNETGNERDRKPEPLNQLEVRQEHLLKELRTIRSRLLKLTENLSKGDVSCSPLPPSPRQPVKLLYVRPSDVDIEKDIAIHVSKNRIPLSVLVLCRQLSKRRQVTISTHFRSTNIPRNSVECLLNGNRSMRLSLLNASEATAPPLKVILIFHDDDYDEITLMISPIQQGKIVSEVNVARYLGRHLEPAYDEDLLLATQVDHWLDVTHGNRSKNQSTIIKEIQNRLIGSEYLVGSSLSLADVFGWSVLHQTNRLSARKLPPNVQKWMDRLTQLDDFEMAARIVTSA